MIRPSLAALAIAGASLFSCASTSAQGLAQSPQSNELATTAAPQDPAKQDPALRAHKEQLEQELQALKKQQKELNALVEKLKARANSAADQGAEAEKASIAEAKQKKDKEAERADQERRERELQARVERIEKRVDTEIQRIRENAKKEIAKAMAEAKKGSDRDVAVVESKKPSMRAARVVPPAEQPREVVLDDVTSESAPQPMFVISEPVEGKPMEVVLQDVTEAKKPKDSPSKSPKVMRTRIVEGQPVEGRVVEGRPIAPVPQTWRGTKVQPAEEDMHVFMTDENGLPGRRIEVREIRMEKDENECCDCDCPMCGKQAKARDAQRNDGPRRQEFRGRMQPRMDEMRNEARRRFEQRMDEHLHYMDTRMAPRMQRNGMPEGDRFMERAMDWRNDPEVERLIEALRKRINERRDGVPPRARNRAEAAPAPQTEEAPIEVRRVRTKKPSNVAPVPMPPAAPQAPEHSHGQHAPDEIAPRVGGGD